MSTLRIIALALGVSVLAAGMIGAKTFTIPPATPIVTSDPGNSAKVGDNPGNVRVNPDVLMAAKGHQLAAFSGGCFWGVEDEFRQVPGVVATAVGFSGGKIANPSYELVCTHTTGHAETCLIEFDPSKVTYKALLKKFWEICDPTTVDRQGPDYGNNYRSAIWTYSDEQQKEAEESKAEDQKKENGPIVTTIQKAMPFYMAEEYHQQYDEKTGRHFCPTDRGAGN